MNERWKYNEKKIHTYCIALREWANTGFTLVWVLLLVFVHKNPHTLGIVLRDVVAAYFINACFRWFFFCPYSIEIKTATSVSCVVRLYNMKMRFLFVFYLSTFFLYFSTHQVLISLASVRVLRSFVLSFVFMHVCVALLFVSAFSVFCRSVCIKWALQQQ